MIELRKLEGETVRLTDIDGDVFEGYVGDYIFPEDNEPEGVESIVLDYPVKNGKTKTHGLIEFYAHDIESIEIIRRK